MSVLNPKREFTLAFDQDTIREAISKLVNNEKHEYELVNDDRILNQVRVKSKGVLMDVGYHIDFCMKKRSEQETEVTVEVSRTIGAIDTKHEIHNSNYILKEVCDKFSAYLSGNVDSSGKAQIPKNEGCIGVLLLLIFIGILLRSTADGKEKEGITIGETLQAGITWIN